MGRLKLFCFLRIQRENMQDGAESGIQDSREFKSVQGSKFKVQR
jgi:hypothetical protein